MQNHFLKKNIRYPIIGVVGLLCTLFFACQTASPPSLANQEALYLNHWNELLTDVIVEDIFTPPVASRIYAYPNIAAYEVLVHDSPELQSLQGQVHELSGLPQPETGQQYDWTVAAVIAFSKVGQQLVYTKKILEDEEQQFKAQKQQAIADKAIFERSVAYGEQMGAAIIAWMNNDNYTKTRTMSRYNLSKKTGAWTPTPPDYMEGIEPNWREIRPFTLDSAQQYPPLPPTAFDTTQQSRFYKEALEVYEIGKKPDEEQVEVAKFWDCNPNVSIHKGHFMYYIKKISPGGHWMGITGICTRQEKLSLAATAEAYTLTAIALADGFISCWDEKYRSILIRPETYINQYIDRDWQPIIQTPAFPEYTSGHSVISAAAATTLTHLFGESYAFNDTVEVKYGLPARSFTSFVEASEEAAISRLYGGIHYMPAITNGVAQGEKIGKHVLKTIHARVPQNAQNLRQP